MEIEYVPHFVFDYLYGTNKTLIIKRDGYTFKINGKAVPESFLGHNQLLHGNLDEFIA